MDLSLEPITSENYPLVKEELFLLVEKIWTKKESSDNAKDSIERWHKNSESGLYFFVSIDKKRIGITGYWPIKNAKGTFGLRHHGTIVKGTGKLSLDLLIKEIRKREKEFVHLIELIPGGREDLISKFKGWGFELDQKGIPEWEPKKDYYKYLMTRSF